METLISKLEDFGINAGWILLALGLIGAYFTFQYLDLQILELLRNIFFLGPVVLIVSFLLFFEYWMYFVRLEFNLAQGRVTLEIKLPQEVFKSPEAMELVLSQIHQSYNPDNHIQTYWDGKHPPMMSLEIVSRGGDVRFYVNVPRKKIKNIIETQLYSQYPGVEVVELPIDYTAEISWESDRFEMFSIHFGLKKPDALPIKTYVDYGLLTMPKEEEKIDPLSAMLETLAGIGPGEHYWVQILIEPNRELDFKTGVLRKKPDWKVAAKKYIEEVIEEAKSRRADGVVGGNVMQLLTETEKDTIKAVERSLGKNAFNVAIRGMYLAERDAFNPGERIGPLITTWRPYDDLNKNAIGVKWRTDFNWNWWQDPSGKRKRAWKKKELNEYKRRAYFRKGSGDKKKVMTTEELATIFHIPGKVILTPTVGRIPSTRSEAPANLPV